MSPHFRAVTRFEFTRTVRRPQFWAAALSFPILFAVIALVMGWANTTTPPASEPIAFEYSDASGLISESVAEKLGGTPAAAGAEKRVQDGELTAYIAFPADPAAEQARIIATDRGIFGNADYTALARTVFNNSIDAAMDPTLTVFARTTLQTSVSAYTDGAPVDGLAAMILPALLALLLLMVISVLGNQMLNSTVEERENRISEMMLVSVPAGTLIRGKITALSLLGLVQIGIVLAAGAIILGVALPALPLAELGLDTPVADPVRLLVGVAILLGGLLMFTALLVLIGAMMPTAKDAAPFFSVIVLVIIAPLYLITAVLTIPGSLVVQTLTYFPLSAPMTALLRNAVGNLDPMLGLLVAVELLVIGALILRVAIAAFQRGVIQYGQRISIRDLVK
jgi:ABC-2 type transport system permease protein